MFERSAFSLLLIIQVVIARAARIAGLFTMRTRSGIWDHRFVSNALALGMTPLSRWHCGYCSRRVALSLRGVMSIGSAFLKKVGATFHRCPSSVTTVTVFLLYLTKTP